jgi:hypothetical protein
MDTKEAVVNPAEDGRPSLKNNPDVIEKLKERMRNSNLIMQNLTDVVSNLHVRESLNANAGRIKLREKLDMGKFDRPHPQQYGVNLKKLKDWSTQKTETVVNQEESQQEIALTKVKDFMKAMRMLVKMQAWFRMLKWKHLFEVHLEKLKQIKKAFFFAWKVFQVAAKRNFGVRVGRLFYAWREEVRDEKRLQAIVRRLFVMACGKLHLTPQAVYAYFNQEKWGAIISPATDAKLRRLILSKLYAGWKKEVRHLRSVRYRAAATLARSFRRTATTMWTKEMVMITFHLWRRYVAVTLSYRNAIPDPVFKSPLIPQWNEYLKELTKKRIKKQRAQYAGQKLLIMRTFGTWKEAMQVCKYIWKLRKVCHYYNSISIITA